MTAALIPFALLVGCANLSSGAGGGTPATAIPEPTVDAKWKQSYVQAVNLLKAGRLNEAERRFKALIVREPKLAGPHVNLGLAYYRLGRSIDAIAEIERAIELNPRASYYNELGMIHRAEGRFDAAERAYRRAIKIDPNYPYAHLNLGILYDLYLQIPDKAMAHYERYRQLVPSESDRVNKWIADLKLRSSRAAEKPKKEKNG